MRPLTTSIPARRRRFRLRAILAVFLIGLVMLNALAWIQVRAMTNFVPEGQSLQAPGEASLMD